MIGLRTSWPARVLSPLPRSGGGQGWGRFHATGCFSKSPLSNSPPLRGREGGLRLSQKRRLLPSLCLSLSLLFPFAAFAVEPGEKLADPKLEARARNIASELRCLVCQNQSIDDSDAPLAKDLRLIVREKLKEGATDAQVRDFVVARYGDFVLLRPPFKIETLALWGAPLIVLCGGGYALYVAFKRSRRRGTDAQASLTDAERAQLQALGATAHEGDNSKTTKGAESL